MTARMLLAGNALAAIIAGSTLAPTSLSRERGGRRRSRISLEDDVIARKWMRVRIEECLDRYWFDDFGEGRIVDYFDEKSFFSNFRYPNNFLFQGRNSFFGKVFFQEGRRTIDARFAFLRVSFLFYW